MKHIKSAIIASIIAGSVFLSCNKLDEEVYSSVFTVNFYKSAQDAEAALTAAYGPLADLYWGPCALLVSDFSADQTYPRAVVGRNTLTLFSYDVDYTTQKSFGRHTMEGPMGIWQFCYKGIENANWVIEQVPAISMEQGRKDAIVGEALFLRALYHFMLTKTFKDIIIRTKPTRTEADTRLAQSSKDEVYVQIFKDLTDAASKLPSYGVNIAKGRASKEVAIALHAKAALYAENWGLAKEKAELVINSGKYTLLPNIVDVFNVDKQDLARVENIFAFEGEVGDAQDFTYMMGLCGPRNSQGTEYGNSTFGSLFAYQAFFTSFDPIDKRRLLLDTNYINRSNVVVAQKDITPITPFGVLVKKYQDKNSNGDRNRTNVPILRFADMFLIAAEAEARASGATSLAYQHINRVRTRAGLPDLTPGLSKDAFIKAVLQERSWEFFAEGDRWFDLTRTNTFLSVIPTAVNDVYPTRAPQAKHRYFPIPQDEIVANPNVQQNPDWR